MMSPRRFLEVMVISVCFALCLSANAFCFWPEFWISPDSISGRAYSNQSSPSVADGQANLLAVWEDERVSPYCDIFGARITPDGEILDPTGISICTASGWQTWVRAAAGSENYLVVWQDDRDVDYDIYGARIDLNGNVLDPDGFPIYAGEGWESSPAVAWDGTNFLVVWSDDSNVYGTRITPQGEILDGTGFQISDETIRTIAPSITFNGSNYLIAWELSSG
ncbi:MAG: hypothetical protein WBC77_11620 [Candidatus Zixiibacteriota bacterium]